MTGVSFNVRVRPVIQAVSWAVAIAGHGALAVWVVIEIVGGAA